MRLYEHIDETAEASGITLYLREIGRLPLLTAEEERTLLCQVAAGRAAEATPAEVAAADAARARLLEHNLRLVGPEPTFMSPATSGLKYG